MNARVLAACGLVAILILGAGGAMAVGFDGVPGADRGPGAGTGPAGPADSASDDAGGADSGGSSAGDGGDGDDGSSDESGSADDAPPFTVLADDVEACGRTCRDVTSTVTNHQNETAEDVSVSTRIYAGNQTNGNPVWQGAEDVGTLGSGESTTATKRIKLSFGQAISVKSKGGWVTIRTTVETADQTVTLTERRQVA